MNRAAFLETFGSLTAKIYDVLIYLACQIK